jgi:methionyl aminopeptidase
MIIIKDDVALEKMRVSGRITAEVRDKTAKMIAPGVTTLELSEYAGNLIKEYGAESAFLGYRGFPGQICVSINDAVVHGVPDGRRIELGDIVSIDIGVTYDGYMGDTATTVMVGVTDEDVIRLVRTTEKSLEAGIEKAVHGGNLSDMSHAIEEVAVAEGFSVVTQFVGHGIGRNLHEDPQIPNFGPAGKGAVLKDGMTLCLEPMINMGVAGVEVLSDGWTVLTKDRKPSAHFEHTIAVRGDKAEVLTRTRNDL